MVFAYADQLTMMNVDTNISVSDVLSLRERLWLGTCLANIESLIDEIGKIDNSFINREISASILMDPCSGIEGGRVDIN